MEEGDTNFFGILKKIEEVCKHLSVPVVVKEVGWGISAQTAKRLVGVGVKAIDVAGAGGTSWSEVEKFRTTNPVLQRIAGGFRGWGIPTTEAIIKIREEIPDIILFASGGLKSGIDITKCLALGANLGGIARSFLIAALKSQETLDTYIEELILQMKIAMFAIGAENIGAISSEKIAQID